MSSERRGPPHPLKGASGCNSVLEAQPRCRAVYQSSAKAPEAQGYSANTFNHYKTNLGFKLVLCLL